MTLSIIIVNYNVKYFLEQCLCSVQEAITNIEAEVIVIDNCSSDGSKIYLASKFPQVIFIQNKKNEGFAKANNQALQIASGKYILFLNPDTILPEDALEQCIFFYQNNAGIGAIGVRMLDGSGNFLPESKRSFPSPLVSFYKLIGLSHLFPLSQRFGRYALRYLSEKDRHEVDVISGAFMMVPKQVLDRTGGFDERFFMYAEDIDLSYRIQKSGFTNFYLGSVSIVHFKGESTKKGSVSYVKTFYEAMSLFVKKYYLGSSAWLLRQALQAGIRIRGAASAIYLPLKRIKTIHQVNHYEEIVLSGNPNQARPAADIIRRFYPDTSVTNTTDLTAKSQRNKNTLLVFCIGVLSYKKSIELLQEQRAVSYKWFGKGSSSIVGSDSRNKSGEVLVR